MGISQDLRQLSRGSSNERFLVFRSPATDVCIGLAGRGRRRSVSLQRIRWVVLYVVRNVRLKDKTQIMSN